MYILCTVENLSIDEQDCGLDFSIRLTGDTRIAGRRNGKRQPQVAMLNFKPCRV
jgi:hypothetical protein